MKNVPIIVVSSPSGGGKGCIVKEILKSFGMLEFSISATTRPQRPEEINGKNYFFISGDEFREHINHNDFLEYEEVYPDIFYGTLKMEIDRITQKGKIPLLELDVFGAQNVKQNFGDRAHLFFIHPGEPILNTLRERLRTRGTETEEQIEKRMKKAEQEITLMPHFDYRILNLNGQLPVAISVTKKIVKKIIESH